MLNYKTCSDVDFRSAMDTLHQIKSGTADITDISDKILYIMYTKMEGDLYQLSGVSGSYAIGLRCFALKNQKLLKSELISRKFLSE